MILGNGVFPININTPNSSNVIYKSASSQNKKIGAQNTALKDYVKCEISSVNHKTESMFECPIMRRKRLRFSSNTRVSYRRNW